MSQDPIPADVRDFLTRYIDSIAQLEALLLLHGHPGSEWTPGEIAQRLYITEPQTIAMLHHLTSDKLLVCPDQAVSRFAYRPGSPELAEAVDRVAKTYRDHLVPVTNLVHAKLQTRVRQFADAFKLRKDE